jgi:hypothetical protein
LRFKKIPNHLRSERERDEDENREFREGVVLEVMQFTVYYLTRSVASSISSAAITNLNDSDGHNAAIDLSESRRYAPRLLSRNVKVTTGQATSMLEKPRPAASTSSPITSSSTPSASTSTSSASTSTPSASTSTPTDSAGLKKTRRTRYRKKTDAESTAIMVYREKLFADADKSKFADEGYKVSPTRLLSLCYGQDQLD